MISLEELTARIGASPFNSWLGLRPVAIDDGGVTIEAEPRAEMLGNPDTQFVHGGVISAMIDATCSYAWLAKVGGYVSTIDLRIDFHSPVPKAPVVIRADIVRAGRRIVTVDARVTGREGKLLASGRSVMMPATSAQPGG